MFTELNLDTVLVVLFAGIAYIYCGFKAIRIIIDFTDLFNHTIFLKINKKAFHALLILIWPVVVVLFFLMFVVIMAVEFIDRHLGE
jgi:hypothetical protein